MLNLLLEFEPNYLISSTKVPPKKNICTCNFQVNERYVGILQKKKKEKEKEKQQQQQQQQQHSVLGVVCMFMTMWNVWAHEYLAILVGCQLFTAYWLSAIIWSRFVNETHEHLINSFIDHRRSDSLCICTKEILLDRQKVGIMPTGYRTDK